jgi:phosphohistidine phosphatase
MNIYLIRHGDAEKSSINKKDFDRDLTASGITKIKTAASSWKVLIENFDCIISSPLIRAHHTASVIAEVYGLKKDIIVDKKLSPGSRVESIIEIANSLSAENIAFVGHQPDLSEHLSGMISSKGAYLEFKKGAIAKISFYNKAHLGKGMLEFLIPASAYK